MKTNRVLVLFLVCLVASVACQSRIPPLGRPGQVTHVVVCWLKSPGDETQQRQLIEVSKSFSAIPGVVSVAVGSVLPSERPIVVSDFDVAIVITFEDQASMNAYLDDPIHTSAVKETLRPLAREVKVYDFIIR